MIKKILPIIATALTFVPIYSAFAAPIVREVMQSSASGSSGSLQPIKVWNGHGVSISFYKTKETIKRVWIDDPSQILLDSDGCLDGIDDDCDENGAGLIHLRRIKRLDIKGMPKTHTTQLTIITESAQGRKSYHFRVIPASGTPEYSQIAIVPDSSFRRNPRRRPAPSLGTYSQY